MSFEILLALGERPEGLVVLGLRVGEYLEVVCKKVFGGGDVVIENIVIEGCIEGRGHRYMVVEVYSHSEIHHILGLGMHIGEGMVHCNMEEVAPPKIDAPNP